VNVRVDPGSKVPPYEQLRSQIEALVHRGRLAPGERLPPVRELAVDLGLATNTVARAYRELEAVGVLVGRGRLGTFVADALPEPPSDARARLADAARAYATRARQLGFDDAAALREVKRALHDG
jgi:DNA-binding transcriptional regulator YhcF (GntR family)